MKALIIGGAGFIGSNLAMNLTNDSRFSEVRVLDNFSSGSSWRLEGLGKTLTLAKGSIEDADFLNTSMEGIDVVFHFAANPDIAKAATDPTVDFNAGTLLTQLILEAMRKSNIKTLMYASGSGVYGEWPQVNLHENHGPNIPVSTYGASKLACEALIASYCFMFDFSARAFRFANVVGAKQTHGVVYDFLRKLQKNPNVLVVMGNGSQTKPYIHVSDVISAMMLGFDDAGAKSGFDVFNVSTSDLVSVKQIAELVLSKSGLAAENAEILFGEGDRGWKGDVPQVQLDAEKIRKLGWRPEHSSKEAITKSMYELIGELSIDGN